MSAPVRGRFLASAAWLWGPAVGWACAIFFVSSAASPVLQPPAPDWVLHGVAYGLLAVLVCRALAGGLGRPLEAPWALLGALIATLYGASDEFHQMFVPGRMAEMRDLVADAAGAVIGSGIAHGGTRVGRLLVAPRWKGRVL
jgi:hypothetical protein